MYTDVFAIRRRDLSTMDTAITEAEAEYAKDDQLHDAREALAFLRSKYFEKEQFNTCHIKNYRKKPLKREDAREASFPGIYYEKVF